MKDFERIFEKMDDFFDRLFDHSLMYYLPYAASWQPPMDIYETRRGYRIVIEAAGLEKDSIRVTLDAGHLVVSGQRRGPAPVDADGCRHLEIARGEFQRTADISDLPVENNFSHCYRNGLLMVKLVKKNK